MSAFERIVLGWIAAAFLIPAGLSAQLHRVEAKLQGIDCASCLESLPERLKRIRGVEEAQVDAGTGTVKIRLTQDNRTRLTAIRDQIQQDGTRVTALDVEATGLVLRDGAGWVFRVEPQTFVLRGSVGTMPGEKKLRGVIRDAGANPMVLELTSP